VRVIVFAYACAISAHGARPHSSDHAHANDSTAGTAMRPKDLAGRLPSALRLKAGSSSRIDCRLCANNSLALIWRVHNLPT